MRVRLGVFLSVVWAAGCNAPRGPSYPYLEIHTDNLWADEGQSTTLRIDQTGRVQSQRRWSPGSGRFITRCTADAAPELARELFGRIEAQPLVSEKEAPTNTIERTDARGQIRYGVTLHVSEQERRVFGSDVAWDAILPIIPGWVTAVTNAAKSGSCSTRDA
jgi:hypothetical protein